MVMWWMPRIMPGKMARLPKESTPRHRRCRVQGAECRVQSARWKSTCTLDPALCTFTGCPMPNYKYLIVGGGMTADAAVAGIREADRDGSIGLIGAEPDPPYNRP